jgi:hypothetical protein
MENNTNLLGQLNISNYSIHILSKYIHELIFDNEAELDFYSASSLKQQSADRHVVPLGPIILIPSQPVFALSQ